ncbi:MAG TPA: hypothetical protein VJP02_14550 [Candidatus Sulfotelmatobacter sp.]|nr:hypothetical protein [Candidatus Sulfotelmatobacter sp.]
MRWRVVVFGLISTVALAQQEVPHENKLHAELRREGERVGDACKFSLKAIPMCGYTLFTDHPLHIAAGSMPPQNGFGVGAAFVWAKNTKNWRTSYDFDAVGATSGAWRVGGYAKFIHTPHDANTALTGTHPYTLFNLYAQSISLNKLNYFGEGNNSSLAGASVFGMTQTIIGANAIKPVYELQSIRKLGLALLGDINGRFVSVRGEHGQSVPSIEALYTDATAPGLSSQPGFVQMSQGVRIKPDTGDVLSLNYLGKFEEFFAPSNSHNSFLRWTVDLNHTIHIYGQTKSVSTSSDRLGPDSCEHGGPKDKCPDVPHTRNLSGFLTARLLVSESINSATSAVPFYFQQTLGGQDIDSNLTLGSFRDYRFRAPNLLLLQESYETSIWGPFGLKFMADEGRVALTRGDLGFSHFRHSYAAGLTLRAGAFPMVQLMFAWGGPEGHHNIFNLNSSLLGGSARPPLD